MHFVHGVRNFECKLGWVADFCPICRTLRRFRLIRIDKTFHVYYISMGGGDLVGFKMECSECKTQLKTTAARHPSSEEIDPEDLAKLAATTLPNLPELLGERLALEKLVSSAPHQLSPQVRRTLLCEPFEVLNPQVMRRIEHIHIDLPIFLSCLAVVVVLALGIPAMARVPTPWEETARYAWFGVVGVAFACAVVQACLVNQRYFRKKIVPLIAKTLRPLRPAKSELETALRTSRGLGLLVAERTNIEELWSLLVPQEGDSTINAEAK